MSLKKNSPGCACCEDSSCVIVKDSLDGLKLSDTWDLMTGSWEDVDATGDYASATGIVEAWHQTPHPDDPYPSDVRLRVRGATDSILRIILSASGDVATGDALIVELAPGAECGTLKLYQRQDGVEDVLATLIVYGAVVDEWHNLRACYDPETTVLTGSILPHDETTRRQISVEVEAHTDGEYAGFASGTADQSDFDSFVYRKLWWDEVITPLCPDIGIEVTQSAGTGLVFDVPGWYPSPGQIDLEIEFWDHGTALGQYIYSITWDITAGQLEAAIQGALDSGDVGLPVPPGGSVAVTGNATDGFSVTFTPGDYDQIQWTLYEYGTENVEWTAGEHAAQNEIQTITVNYPGSTGCQTFTLTLFSQTTDPLATDATAATIQDALELLTGEGNIAVYGPAGGPWEVNFVGGNAEQDVMMIVADTTVCGDCRAYGYYYEADVVRHTCSTCGACAITVDPAKYPEGALPCTYSSLVETWAVDADGHINGVGDLARVEQAAEAKYVAFFQCEEIYSGTTIEIFGVTATFTKLTPDPGYPDNQWQIDFSGNVTDTLTETYAEEGDGKAWMWAYVCRHATYSQARFGLFPASSAVVTRDYTWNVGYTPPESAAVTVGVHAVANMVIAMQRHAYYGGNLCWSCFSCDSCDDDHKPHEALRVDLGTWGLTKAASMTLGSGAWTGVPACNWCDQVEGNWIVLNPSVSTCQWVGGESGVCSINSWDTETGLVVISGGGDFLLTMTLTAGLGGTYRWQLTVYLGYTGVYDPGSPPYYEYGVIAYYASDYFDPDECDVFPRTMTLTDFLGVGFTYRLVGCAGTPPTTVTLTGA